MSDRAVDVLPRGLQLTLAARFVGIGVTKFNEMVSDGRMPKARRIDSRKVWDYKELDAAFDALPHDGDEDEGKNPWDDVTA
jgi:predicted DNA-binding transcriptional regulator AlpA